MAVEHPEALIEADLAERILAVALRNGGDWAELFCEERASFGLGIDESRVEGVTRGRDSGAGVRVVIGETTYFAHVDGLAEPDLERAAEAASAALGAGRTEPAALGALVRPEGQPIDTDPGGVPAEHKADLLRACDEVVRGCGAEIVQASASYSEARRRITVANSLGTFACDDRLRTRLGVQAVAAREDRVETGFQTRGAHRGFELLTDGQAEAVAENAGRVAVTMLGADPAPAGSMPVVVGDGFGGVLFHEMTGHGVEADHIQKGASVYAGMLGEQVADSRLVAYDDGRLPSEWGTEGVDDEGTPTQRTPVIEDGRLTGYLYDLIRARKDGVASTANGRRQSFRHLPIPRMTNTYIAPSEGVTPEALIGDVERGFYAVSFAGGQVDPTTGDFVFGVSEGYLIENGKVTRPCRGATLIGNCLAALRAIDGVANDFDVRTGFCGKGGQSVPVGVGQGHVRISQMTVGGTAV